MNIFFLDKDPIRAAQMQYNKHVVKMVLESAQMLCTAHHYYGNGDSVPYKPCHMNHPSTKWVRQSADHYHWLYVHMLALGEEYKQRYNKEHLVIKKCKHTLDKLPPRIPNRGFKQPPQCMPDEYKDECSINAYWKYYIGEKHTVANSKTENIYK